VTSVGSVWDSADGLEWHEVSGHPSLPGGMAAAALDGTVLLSRVGIETIELVTSPDGRAWTELPEAGGCEGPGTIVAPSPSGVDRWILTRGGDVCASADLTNWTTSSLGERMGVRIAQTRYGAVALAQHCTDTSVPCGIETVTSYLSRDGVDWVTIAAPPSHLASIADGPAGVVAIVPYDGIWRLAP
jgi:hypothetical protein